MLRNLCMRGRNLLSSSISPFSASNPNRKSLSSSSISFNFYTSKSHSENETLYDNPIDVKNFKSVAELKQSCSSESHSENPNSSHTYEYESEEENPTDFEDVSSEELRTQIDRFYKGDVEAIPTILESILKRKLTGKHADSDDELMNEFQRDRPSEVSDDDFDSDSSSDSDG